jgi:hypothetical protein
MAITLKELIPAKTAETAQTLQYTVPTATAQIHQFTATNTTGGPLTVTVNLVPNGGTAGSSNAIVSARQIAAGQSRVFPELVNHVLGSGGTIYTATSGSGITIKCSGVEVTT